MIKRMMIVDDEESILDMLSLAMTRFGFEVVTESSAEAALKTLSGEKIHCILTDLHLPGMDGLQLCREIRKNNPISFIYAMTGYANVFELFDCREAGFDDYFLKPLEIQVLRQAVEDAFARMERWKTKKQPSLTA